MSTLPFLAGNYGGQERTKYDGFRFGSRAKAVFGKDFFESSFAYINNQSHETCGSNSTRSGKQNTFRVVASVKKGRKHEYPWPDNIDPNITSGHLTYLSHFKPLTEKPKPVFLPFEKSLIDLEQKIIEISKMADETGLDFSDQIGTLERKYQQALKDMYTHLTPIQRLSIARHPNRPTVLDHILTITEKWVELHGDRAGYDDPAIVTGIGSINGKSYMFIGHQKGRNTKENIARNFAMPTPHGYRKALRLMKYADHHGFPIITLVDTPGAFADLKSEELGQGEAIAYNLRAMFGFEVPIITIVTGEGGSGGALAIVCANKLFMLENSAFYVASPEACAAILWKSSQAAPKAAEKLRITAQEHYRLGIADGIIPEPLGGAHADPSWTSQQIKFTIIKAMEELASMSTEELLHHRMLKYRSIGGFQDGVPVEPQRKRNMKQSDVKTSTADLESEIVNLKRKIIEAKGPSEPITSDAIEKLKEEVDKDITNAFISMGLEEKLEAVKLEISRSSNKPNQPLGTGLKKKVDEIMQEFKHKFSQPGAYLGLKQKFEKLNSIIRLIEMKQKRDKLKMEINQKLHNEVKAKMELIKNLEEKISQGKDLNKDMLEELERTKEDLKELLTLADLEIIEVRRRNLTTLPPQLKDEIVSVNKEINQEIEKAVLADGLTSKIEKLKAEVSNGSPAEHVQKLQAEIKEEILTALNAEHLKGKVEDIRSKLEQSTTANAEIRAENGWY